MSKYRITWHAANRLIEVKVNGFWSRDDFVDYQRDLFAAIEQANGGPFDLMTDVTERSPQAPDLIAVYGETVARLIAMGLRRTVMIGASPLLGMQIRRVTSALRPRFVASAEEGRRWLKAPSGSTE